MNAKFDNMFGHKEELLEVIPSFFTTIVLE